MTFMPPIRIDPSSSRRKPTAALSGWPSPATVASLPRSCDPRYSTSCVVKLPMKAGTVLGSLAFRGPGSAID